jgi:hypothetical protein
MTIQTTAHSQPLPSPSNHIHTPLCLTKVKNSIMGPFPSYLVCIQPIPSVISTTTSKVTHVATSPLNSIGLQGFITVPDITPLPYVSLSIIQHNVHLVSTVRHKEIGFGSGVSMGVAKVRAATAALQHLQECYPYKAAHPNISYPMFVVSLQRAFSV